MKKLLFYALLGLACAYFSIETLHAQISDFKLSDFKLPDYKRQGIDLDFSLRENSLTDKNNMDKDRKSYGWGVKNILE